MVLKNINISCKDDFFSEGDKPIGKGGFGQVWKVRHKLSNKIYVIKVMNKKNIIEQKMVEQINREVDIMYRVNHPHIIKLYNHYEDEDNLYLIMQYASKGQLYAQLKRQTKFDQKTAAQYLRELISAVKYLHTAFQPSIIHRDIKPENILLDENGSVKLADFGWSNYEGDIKRQTYCGTPEYLAPEMIRKEGHDTGIDIWDLGVLAFELLAGKPPFQGANNTELFSNIKKHKIHWPDDFPPLAKNLISKILKQNPKERLTLDEIINHAWFEKNPPLYPVTMDVENFKESPIESNLINIKPEEVKEQIILLSEKGDKEKSNKKRITEKNIVNTPIVNTVGIGGGELSKHSLTMMSNSNENEEVEKYKKEKEDYKNKLDKADNEIKNLKLENLKYKESYCKTSIESDYYKIKDELEKYKIMNKDRLGLLTEIEEKNNENSDLKNKIKYLENEIEALKRNLKNVQENNSELQSTNEANEIKLSELNKTIDDLAKEKSLISSEYQKKLEILQAKMLDNIESNSDDVDQQDATERLISIINDSIEDFKTVFKNKSSYLEKTLRDIREEREKAEKKIYAHFEEKHLNVIDTIKKIKSSLEEDFINIKLKLKKENPMKINERVGWLKKQINELMTYKTKSSGLELLIQKQESQLKAFKEKMDLDTINIELLEKVKKDFSYKITTLEKYNRNLEDRLSDLKDFIFKNCSEKFEELNKFYKI